MLLSIDRGKVTDKDSALVRTPKRGRFWRFRSFGDWFGEGKSFDGFSLLWLLSLYVLNTLLAFPGNFAVPHGVLKGPVAFRADKHLTEKSWVWMFFSVDPFLKRMMSVCFILVGWIGICVSKVLITPIWLSYNEGSWTSSRFHIVNQWFGISKMARLISICSLSILFHWTLPALRLKSMMCSCYRRKGWAEFLPKKHLISKARWKTLTCSRF